MTPCNDTPSNHCSGVFVQFPMTSLREIRILQLLNHENIVPLVEICRAKGVLHELNMYTMYCAALEQSIEVPPGPLIGSRQ